MALNDAYRLYEINKHCIGIAHRNRRSMPGCRSWQGTKGALFLEKIIRDETSSYPGVIEATTPTSALLLYYWAVIHAFVTRFIYLLVLYQQIKLSSSTCLVVEKEERGSEREAQNVTARCYETTSRVLPSLQSDDLPGEVGSRESQVSYTKKHAESWRCSSRMSSVMQ